MRWLAALLLVPLSIGLSVAILEAGFRTTHYLFRGPDSLPTVSDPELGWVHNTTRKPVRRENACGEEVVTLPATHPYIIKYPRDAGGIRLLVLGDSTTHGHEVSTGAAFHDIIEHEGHGRYSVWAAGVGGYGNLQEYLVLRKLYDEIRPDVVIWQLDSNDMADNVYELDHASLSSSMKPRPYLDPVSETITVRNPALLLFDLSQGARYLYSGLAGLEIQYEWNITQTVERWLNPPADRTSELERQGLEVLNYVVREARRRYPETRFIGLSLSESEDGSFAEIFERHGAEYWRNFTARVRASSTRPTQCLPWDRHWNHEGNRLAGRLIVESLALSNGNAEQTSSLHRIAVGREP
jgi:hypothetical protein